MGKYIYIQCSNCGKQRRVNIERVNSIVRPVQMGWGSYGSALYCWDCSKTWKERNGDKPMAGTQHTVDLIARQAAMADMRLQREG